jgi:hypothetical protein
MTNFIAFFIDILVNRAVFITTIHHFFTISTQKPMVIIQMIPESSRVIMNK